MIFSWAQRSTDSPAERAHMDTINYVINTGPLNEAAGLMRRLGVADEGIELMASRSTGLMVRVNGVDARSAAVIKQEMLFLGGDAALPAPLYAMEGSGDLLLLGTPEQLAGIGDRLGLHQGALAARGAEISQAWENYRSGLEGRGRLPHPFGDGLAVMGILNVTPDSFHDGGRFLSPSSAVRQAQQMIEEGADIIDVGGESTRPGAGRVSEREELERVIPVIEAVSALGVPVSIDTYKEAVAREALAHGAQVINDITALDGDGKMASLASREGCVVCLMHMQGTPTDMQKNPYYEDVVDEVYSFLKQRIDWAVARGIVREKIIIDPGIGFGKNLQHNLALLGRLDSFLSLGCPLLLGVSRKSFIGMITGAESEDRLAGTLAANVLSYRRGARIFRVHDVAENRQALDLTAAIGGGYER